jgi:hypothetical protein
MESAQPGDEELSETERHWNQLALGIATVATAVIAAVLLTTGLDSENSELDQRRSFAAYLLFRERND